MKIIGIFEAKTKLSRICDQVAGAGEPIVISKHGKPLVKIVPYSATDKPHCVWDTIAESREEYGPLDEEWESIRREPIAELFKGCLDDNGEEG